MPFYNFKNNETQETREVMLPISKVADGYRGENGDEDGWERIYEGASIFTETKNRVGK